MCIHPAGRWVVSSSISARPSVDSNVASCLDDDDDVVVVDATKLMQFLFLGSRSGTSNNEPASTCCLHSISLVASLLITFRCDAAVLRSS